MSKFLAMPGSCIFLFLSVNLWFRVVLMEPALYDQDPDIEILTPTNFYETVIQNEGIWFVHWYLNWSSDCQKVKPEMVKLSKRLKGVVKVGAIDAQFKDFRKKNNVRNIPTVFIYGRDKYNPVLFTGRLHADDFAKEVVKERSVSEGYPMLVDGRVLDIMVENVEKLVSESSIPWLIIFYTPWCGYLLSEVWKEVASSLQGRVKVGSIACERTAEKYNVKKFPTAILFQKGHEKYTNVITSENVVKWILEKIHERPQTVIIKEKLCSYWKDVYM